MEEYGILHFNNEMHPGKCTINEKNNINVTVYECDIGNSLEKISARLSNKHYEIYRCRFIDNGIGFYKYQADYACIYRLYIEKYSNNIYDFRFTFEPLNDWLNFKNIDINNNNIKINIPEDIVLFNNGKIKIKIKYFKEGLDNDTKTNRIDEIKVEPYIVVKQEEKLSIQDIKNYIHIITRFFALLIGYTGNVQKILFHYYNEHKKLEFEFTESQLIINTDFSNNYSIEDVYDTYNLRTFYNNINQPIEELFTNWFNLCSNENYNRIVIQYFSPYTGRTIEEKFLALVRAIEELYELKIGNNKSREKDKKIKLALEEFYNIHSEELKNILKEDIGFKSKEIKKYENKLKEIHMDVIDSLIYEYDMRITLDVKLKKLDESSLIEKIFKKEHILNKASGEAKKQLSVYNYIANTRNFYTHLSDKEYDIIDEDYIDKYSRVLEKVLIMNLMEDIKLNKTYVDKILQRDTYLNVYYYIDNND